MFIEKKKLTEENFLNIIKNAGYKDFSVSEVKYKIDNPNPEFNYIYVRYFNGGYGPQPEFKCTDFEMTGINSCQGYNLHNAYRAEMSKTLDKHNKKPYLDALNKYFDDIKEEAMKSINN